MKKYRGHLALTIRWLLGEIKETERGEKKKYNIPAGVSLLDFNSDIRYLDGMIRSRTHGAVTIRAHVDLQRQEIIGFASEEQKISKILKKASEIIESESRRYIYDKKQGGFINPENNRQNVTFRERTTARLVLDELYERRESLTTSKEISGAISEKTGKKFTPGSVRATIANTINPKFNNAKSSFGFPYEITHPDFKEEKKDGRSMNRGKNSGFGLFST